MWQVIRDEHERIEYYEDTGERSSLSISFRLYKPYEVNVASI